MKTTKFYLASVMSLAALAMIVMPASAARIPMGSIDDLHAKVLAAQPGDTIIFDNGVYSDISITLNGTGAEGKPIVVMAETPGQVIITGNSNLTFNGDYTELNGVCFKDGYTTSRGVIVFAANNCRLTNSAILDYNPESKWTAYRWVDLGGRFNRVDHCSFVGKLNSQNVICSDLSGRGADPHHQIDHNYFGKRQMLGSNGGETIRIGNSGVSMNPSNTVIEDNIFEECDGEVEIVSIKSCDNIIRNNVFLRCAGVLALRHGDRNLVEGNFFNGEGKSATGGVRVIGADHTVKNNVFYQLRGVRFFSALALMDAVPNSTPNRYLHVKNVEVSNNSFYDCTRIEFGAGSDSERTLAPEDIDFKNNAFYGTGASDPTYKIESSLDGYKFVDNYVQNTSVPNNQAGFSQQTLTVKEYDGAKYVSSKNGKVGVATLPNLVTRDNVGAEWHDAVVEETRVLSGNVVKVKAGVNTLADAVKNASNGDVIELSEAATYLNGAIIIDKFLVIKAADGLATRPVLGVQGGRGALMTIADGGELIVDGIEFDGAAGSAPSAFIATAAVMAKPYYLEVNNCAFHAIYSTPNSCIRAYKGSFANEVKISNSIFYDCSSDAINFGNEKDDDGRYSVELIEITNCVFFRMMGGALSVYRGGTDESTSGPFVYMSDCTFVDVDNREQGQAVRLIGPQKIDIKNCNFYNSGAGGASIRLEEKRWDDINIRNVNLWNSGRIDAFWGLAVTGGQTEIEAEFVDVEALDFRLVPNSPLNTLADDGKALGARF